MKDKATAAMKDLLSVVGPMTMMLRRSETPSEAKLGDTLTGLVLAGNRIVEIREHLIPKMEAGVEADIADLRMGVELHDLQEKFDALLKQATDLSAPNATDECDCPPCTLRRTIATKLGISVENVEVKIMMDRDDDGDEPDAEEIGEAVKEAITKIFSKAK